MTGLPRPEEAARLTAVLQEYPRWSAFWDKRYRVWRVSAGPSLSSSPAGPSPSPGTPPLATLVYQQGPALTADMAIKLRRVIIAAIPSPDLS